MYGIEKINLTERTELCDLFDLHFSDKGGFGNAPGWHNYSIYYYQVFNSLRYREMNVFELGIGTNFLDVESTMGESGKPGASLRGWRDFFPNSLIFGADVDSRILFSEERIKTFYCDQTDPSSINKMWGILNRDFDIIVEDGLHKFDANICFLENSSNRIKIGGHYIIEDVLNDDLNSWLQKKEEYRSKLPHLEFRIISLELSTNTYDNNIIHIIRKY